MFASLEISDEVSAEALAPTPAESTAEGNPSPAQIANEILDQPPEPGACALWDELRRHAALKFDPQGKSPGVCRTCNVSTNSTHTHICITF